MASYAGTLKDEKGNNFYPKSANDHKIIGTTSNFFSDLYCNMFARDPALTGYLALKVGNVKQSNENFMITVKGHFFNYDGATEWEASCYFWNNGTNKDFQACTCRINNMIIVKDIYWATGTDGYVYLVFSNGGQAWNYTGIYIDKVYVGWSINGYENLWSGWGTSLISALDGNFTKYNLCTHRGDMLAHYPVGSIYMSTSSTNPSSFIGGTWEQIKGRFLLGVGNCDANTDTYFGSIQSYSWNAGPGSKGGEDFHTLTTAQIPSHRHSVSITSGGGGNHYHTIRYGGAGGSHLIVSYESGSTSMLNLNNYQWVNSAYGNLYASSVGDHTHSVSGNTGYKCDGGNHNNMPPYYAVYIWRRTA